MQIVFKKTNWPLMHMINCIKEKSEFISTNDNLAVGLLQKKKKKVIFEFFSLIELLLFLLKISKY